MTSITEILAGDLISDSRSDINTNFTNLNDDKIETSYLDTDTTLSANSDTKIPTQKAVKAYADAVSSPTGKSWNNYAVDAVGSDSYAITLTGYTAYTAGDTFKFKAGTANTGACSLNVNGLGAKTIKKDVSTDLETGDILQNQIVTVIYDGTNMQLISFPTLISKYQSIMVFKNGSTTYNMNTASGTQNIAHGIGAVPKYVRITAGLAVDARDSITNTFSTYNGTTQASFYVNLNQATQVNSGNTFTLVDELGANQTGVITMDSTNIIITWTKTGEPSGTAYILWEAQY